MNAVDRYAEILRMRAEGTTWRVIGERIGVSYQRAQQIAAEGLCDDPELGRILARRRELLATLRSAMWELDDLRRSHPSIIQ